VNELGAKFVFKRGNLFADRGLTNSQFLRDGRKAPSVHRPDEHPHRVKLIHEGLPYSPTEWILSEG
jgi:hypothetical protein